MDWKNFLEKHDLMKAGILEVAGFMTVMDYIYCTKTKEQAIEIMKDFYDNADDIFNSLKEDSENVSELIDEFIKTELTNNENADDEDVPHHAA